MDQAELYRLFEEARACVSCEESAGQVIAVKTEKGRVYHFYNYHVGETAEEDRFLELLRENDDARVGCLVCMWHDLAIDVPSMHFRRGLAGLCPDNVNAVVLLQGEKGFTVRSLQSTMPL